MLILICHSTYKNRPVEVLDELTVESTSPPLTTLIRAVHTVNGLCEDLKMKMNILRWVTGNDWGWRIVGLSHSLVAASICAQRLLRLDKNILLGLLPYIHTHCLLSNTMKYCHLSLAYGTCTLLMIVYANLYTHATLRLPTKKPLQ